MQPLFTVSELRCLAGLYLVLFTGDCAGLSMNSAHWALCLAVPLICLERFLRAYPGLRSAGLRLLSGMSGTAIVLLAGVPSLLKGEPEANIAAIGLLLGMSALVLTDLSLIGYCGEMVPANCLMPAVLALGLVSFAGVVHLVGSTVHGTTCAVAISFAVALNLVILIKSSACLEAGPFWNPGTDAREGADRLERLLLMQAELTLVMQNAVGAYASHRRRPVRASEEGTALL